MPPERPAQILQGLALTIALPAFVWAFYPIVEWILRGDAVDLSEAQPYIPAGFRLLTAALTVWALAALFRLSPNGEGGGESRVRKATMLALGILAVVGFGLRFSETYDYGIAPDEAQFLWGARARTLHDLFDIWIPYSPHPPLYVLLLHGIQKVTHEVVWVRLPTVLAGVAYILAGYAFARTLSGRFAGLCTATLIAFSPALIELSRVARNYMIAYAVMALALVLLLHHFRTGHWRYLLGYAILAAIGIATIYPLLGAFAASSVVVFAFYCVTERTLARWLVAGLYQLPIGLTALALNIFHVQHIERSVLRANRHWSEGRTAQDYGSILTPLRQQLDFLTPELFQTVLVSLVILGATSLLFRRRWIELTMGLSAPLAAYWMLVEMDLPLGFSRHGAHLSLFYFYLAAIGLSLPLDAREVWTRLRNGAVYLRSGLQALATKRNQPINPSIKGALAAMGAPLSAANEDVTRWRKTMAFNPSILTLAVAGVALVGAFSFANASMNELADGRPGAYDEVVPAYTVGRVAQTFELLETDFDPAGLVILDRMTLWTFVLHYDIPPTRTRDQDATTNADTLPFHHGAEMHIRRGDRDFYTYCSGPFVGRRFRVGQTLECLRRHFDLGDPRPVAVIAYGRGPQWLLESPDTPEAAINLSLFEQSGGLLVAFTTEGAAELEARWAGTAPNPQFSPF